MHHHHHLVDLGSAMAFLLFGLATSLHCAGMCLPLSCLFCRSQTNKTALFLYHVGRFVSYVGLGMAGGYLGLMQYPFMRYSIIIPAFILMFLALIGSYLPLPQSRLLSKVTGLSQSYPRFGGFVLGALTPLLPCGMLYTAVGGAAMAPTSILGGYWMALFALGTMPLMVLGQTGYLFVEKMLPSKVIRVLQWVLMALSLVLFLSMRPQ